MQTERRRNAMGQLKGKVAFVTRRNLLS